MIRVGTRASALARRQSGMIAEEITALTGRPARLVDVVTHGDVSRASLRTIGGTGVFVSALRSALVAGEVDVAVHSLKDLPTAPAPGVVLAAVPAREDPRDALVARDGLRLAELPDGARVGTGSARRAAMVRSVAARAGRVVEVVDIRGNVPTRLARVGDDLDAVVLALAGLRRLRRTEAVTEVLDPDDVLPCAGQGALAVEVRVGDELATELAPLEDTATRAAVTAERAVLAGLGAGCSTPVGALATVEGSRLRLRAALDPAVDAALDPLPPSEAAAASAAAAPAVAAVPVAAVLRAERSGPAAAAEQLGAAAAADLLGQLPPGLLAAQAGRLDRSRPAGPAGPARSPVEERVR